MGLNKSELAKQLGGLHMMTAMLFPEPLKPIVMLKEEEANALADALMGVAKHYDLGVVFDNKYMAIGNLAVCVGMIYVPRYLLLSQVSAQMRKNPVQSPADIAGAGLSGLQN